MKVEQLISQLQSCPPDAEVEVSVGRVVSNAIGEPVAESEAEWWSITEVYSVPGDSGHVLIHLGECTMI